MAIPRRALQRAVESHPDDALVALPVSLVREILSVLPAADALAARQSQRPQSGASA